MCLFTPPGSSAAARPALTVNDVLRQHAPAFLEAQAAHLSAAQRRTLHALTSCRTAALGGHVFACDHCGQQLISYNSCRNRHCPGCQAGVRARWLEQEAGWLLPVDYYHVVFTLPHELGPLALQNPQALYGLLFRAAATALRRVAADPRWLGAEVGAVAVLHTWGQTLSHHPHLHLVVSGGGLACDGAGQVTTPWQWRSCRPGFFLPVQVLGRVFREAFLAGLERLRACGELVLTGRLTALQEPTAWQELRATVQAKPWVVYVQAPCGRQPEQVLKYLARYVRRVALSDHRLVAADADTVTFTVKDYADGGKPRRQTLAGVEFVRRFLQHVLPKGFVQVRHYGLLANGHRAAKLAACRRLLGWERLQAQVAPPAAEPTVWHCPVCGVGRLVLVEELPRGGRVPVAACDTS
jgi:hypothetical protein